MQGLSDGLAAAGREIGVALARAGVRAWVVGGGPRDLALERSPVDIDMASAATPEVVERAFERTVPVGRAFGTIVIRAAGIDVQHTTFRSDGRYSDGRRPDSVAFGATVAEDASRRDFTCNALYLDPLEDAFEDPEGGLADLEARRLRCVGDPATRFREDGLRLLRLARFAAALDLAPDPATLAGAREARETLAGVSAERVLDELSKIASRPGATRALGLLDDLLLLGIAMPGIGTSEGRWKGILPALPDPPGIALCLAALLGPDPPGDTLLRLRPSRALSRSVESILRVAREAPAALAGSRSERARWMQSADFEDGLRLAEARAVAAGEPLARFEEARRESREARPEAWITSEDLASAGVPPGRRFGELLRAAAERQLDGAFRDRSEALAWLRVAAQDGGKTPRKA
jgi:tRNA nucleotidyltransferase/poly(A) polymerase